MTVNKYVFIWLKGEPSLQSFATVIWVNQYGSNCLHQTVVRFVLFAPYNNAFPECLASNRLSPLALEIKKVIYEMGIKYWCIK